MPSLTSWWTLKRSYLAYYIGFADSSCYFSLLCPHVSCFLPLVYISFFCLLVMSGLAHASLSNVRRSSTGGDTSLLQYSPPYYVMTYIRNFSRISVCRDLSYCQKQVLCLLSFDLSFGIQLLARRISAWTFEEGVGRGLWRQHARRRIPFLFVAGSEMSTDRGW